MDPNLTSEISDYWLDSERENLEMTKIPKRSFFNSRFVPDKSIEVIRLEEKIKNIRKDNWVLKNEVSANERNSTKGLIQGALKEIEKQFEIHLRDARAEHCRMQEEFASKSDEFVVISRYLSDAEVLIMQTRMDEIKTQTSKKISKDVEDEQKKVMNKEMDIVKLKINALKDAIKAYTQTTESTNEKISELEKVLIETKAKKEAELRLYDIQSKEHIIQTRKELLKLKDEYETFKETNLKILADSEIKCQNNQATMHILQNELKNAKIILQNPVLKLRVYDKLQEYIEEYQGPSKIPATAPVNGQKHYHRARLFSSKPEATKDLLENEKMFTPSVSKVKVFQRNTSCDDKKSKASKSIRILSKFQNSSFNIEFS